MKEKKDKADAPRVTEETNFVSRNISGKSKDIVVHDEIIDKIRRFKFSSGNVDINRGIETFRKSLLAMLTGEDRA